MNYELIPHLAALWQTEKPAAEDWNPSTERGTVYVSEYSYKVHELHKFVVAGSDDTMMSLYVNGHDKAQRVYLWLNGLSVIFKQDLLDNGFEYE